MREKPIVLPAMIGDEAKSIARKDQKHRTFRCRLGPSCGLKVGERWIKARVVRIEYAVLHLTSAA